MKFRELQAVYMPLAPAVLNEDSKAQVECEDVENVRIGLPSDFTSVHRARICDDRLIKLESRYREAMCREALQDVRNKLHSLAYLYRYKKVNIRHQGPSTRARADLAKHEGRKQRAIERYRRSRRAKLALCGPGAWENELQELRDGDIRHLTDDDPDTAQKKRKQKKPGPSEGSRKLSWIWKGADADGNASATDSLRVEWTKARARAMRWWEEKRALPEEMRRCMVTFMTEERAWKMRETSRTVNDPHLQEGLVAYAVDQARIRREMRASFRDVCLPIARQAGGGSGAEWAPVEGVSPGLYTDSEEQDADYANAAMMNMVDEVATIPD